ncbi:MAG: hypothetical protein HRT90_10015 [Candidatus Margulisbacteria bacterium]|nr:hypothetical protein [Candidatus Margulisiibacteriota bacterium]
MNGSNVNRVARGTLPPGFGISERSRFGGRGGPGRSASARLQEVHPLSDEAKHAPKLDAYNRVQPVAAQPLQQAIGEQKEDSLVKINALIQKKQDSFDDGIGGENIHDAINIQSKWYFGTVMTGIKVIKQIMIRVSTRGFVGDDANFSIIALFQPHVSFESVNPIRLTLRRQIMQGRARTWVTRSWGQQSFRVDNNFDSLGKWLIEWRFSLNAVEVPQDFFDLNLTVPNDNRLPHGARYTLVIPINGFDEVFDHILVVPDTIQPVLPHIKPKIHDLSVPFVPRIFQQCKKCSDVFDTAKKAMNHLSDVHVKNDEMTEKDLWMRPMLHYFAQVSSGVNPRTHKTRECPNHYNTSDGPYACESFFPDCDFKPNLAEDGSPWKQMLEHLKATHRDEVGVNCETCGHWELTYKDMKTHAKSTKHYILEGRQAIAKHQFLERNDYRAPFLCNCDARTSQNWHIETRTRYVLSQPKLEKAERKAKPRKRNRIKKSHTFPMWQAYPQPVPVWQNHPPNNKWGSSQSRGTSYQHQSQYQSQYQSGYDNQNSYGSHSNPLDYYQHTQVSQQQVYGMSYNNELARRPYCSSNVNDKVLPTPSRASFAEVANEVPDAVKPGAVDGNNEVDIDKEIFSQPPSRVPSPINSTTSNFSFKASANEFVPGSSSELDNTEYEESEDSRTKSGS